MFLEPSPAAVYFFFVDNWGVKEIRLSTGNDDDVAAEVGVKLKRSAENDHTEIFRFMLN